MAIVAKQLAQFQPTTTAANYYTPTVGKSAVITEIILCNVTGAAVTVDISIVPPAGAMAIGNRILANVLVSPGQPFAWPISQPVAPGGFIAALASANSGLTVTIAGTEY
jgi:hypothetical protein